MGSCRCCSLSLAVHMAGCAAGTPCNPSIHHCTPMRRAHPTPACPPGRGLTRAAPCCCSCCRWQRRRQQWRRLCLWAPAAGRMAPFRVRVYRFGSLECVDGGNAANPCHTECCNAAATVHPVFLLLSPPLRPSYLPPPSVLPHDRQLFPCSAASQAPAGLPFQVRFLSLEPTCVCVTHPGNGARGRGQGTAKPLPHGPNGSTGPFYLLHVFIAPCPSLFA